MSRLYSPSSPCPRYAGHKYLQRKSIFHISYGKIPEGNFNVIVFYKANLLLGHFHVDSKMLHFLFFLHHCHRYSRWVQSREIL